MFNRDNPFGARPPQQGPARRPVPQNQGDYRPSSHGQDYPPAYASQRPAQNFSRPQQSGIDEKPPSLGSIGGSARPLSLQPAKNPGGNVFAYGNLAAVSPEDFPGGDQMLIVNGSFVIPVRPHERVMRGQIGFTDPQRKWMNISLGPNELVEVAPFRAPIGKGPDSVPFIGRMDVELSWYSPAKTSNNPIHQIKFFENFLRVRRQFRFHLTILILMIGS
jgi:vesicle-fusing ATPase